MLLLRQIVGYGTGSALHIMGQEETFTEAFQNLVFFFPSYFIISTDFCKLASYWDEVAFNCAKGIVSYGHIHKLTTRMWPIIKKKKNDQRQLVWTFPALSRFPWILFTTPAFLCHILGWERGVHISKETIGLQVASILFFKKTLGIFGAQRPSH